MQPSGWPCTGLTCNKRTVTQTTDAFWLFQNLLPTILHRKLISKSLLEVISFFSCTLKPLAFIIVTWRQSFYSICCYICHLSVSRYTHSCPFMAMFILCWIAFPACRREKLSGIVEQLSDLRLSTLEIGHLQICSVTEIAPKSPFLREGPKGVKWELGFAYLGPEKMGLTALGLGFNHWERDRKFLNWEWDISPLMIFEYIIWHDCSHVPILWDKRNNILYQ